MDVCFEAKRKLPSKPLILLLVFNQARTIEMQMLMTVTEDNHSHADRICVWIFGYKDAQ